MRGISTKLKLTAAGLLVAVGSFFAINHVISDAEAVAPDCTANAVIKCGVTSVSDMRAKYNNDYTRGAKNIFSGMGISSNVVNNYKVQEGLVHGNGNVTIGGKVVATGAHSAGRHQMVGGTKRTYNGTTFYDRPVGLWNISSWPSYVFTDKNGKFVGAVMKNCGNPVKANPVKPPEPPKPVYRCASLSRIKQDNPAKYVFRGKSAAEKGAKATGFTFEFGDGKSQYVAVQRTEGKYAFADAPYTYAKSGTYNVKVTAHFTVNGKEKKVTSDNCQKPVTIKIPKPTPPPAPEPPKKESGVAIEKKVSADKKKDTGMTREEALEQARNFRPKGNCTTVMTPAVHLETGATYTFTSGCLPNGWVRQDRAPATTTSTASATTSRNTSWEDHARVAPGTPFKYRVVVTNTGETTLKNVKVSDPAPRGVTFTAADKGTVSGNVWTHTIPELKVGQSFTVVITATIATADGKVVKNEACVDAHEIPGKKDACDDATVDTKKPEPTPEPTPEPKYIEVCVLKTKEYPVTIKEEDFDSKLHSRDAEDCKEDEKPAPEPEPTKPVVKEEVTELPQTGIAEAMSGVIGLGSLTTAGYYYLASRRNG